MMKKSLLCLSGILLTAMHSNAQFEYSYGTGASERSRGVITTSVGNYLVAGNSNAGFIGGTDAVLLYTQPNGTPISSNAFGGPQADAFNSVRETPAGWPVSYVAAGTTSSFGFGNDDFYLVGVNGGGAPVFSKTFGGANIDRAYCIQVVDDPLYGPGYIMVGETWSFPNFFPGANIFVVRTDMNGNILQSSVIGGPGNDFGYWIEQTSDKGYVVVGSTTSVPGCAGSNTPEIFVVKLNQNLNIVWNEIVGINPGAASSQEVAYCVKEHPVDNTLIVTGSTKSFGAGIYDAFLLRLPPAGGAPIMLKTYGQGGDDQARGLAVHFDPFSGAVNYVVSGFTNSYSGNYDVCLFKTDDMGIPLWHKVYPGSNDDYAFELNTNGIPGYVLTGETFSFGAGLSDLFLIETDINGQTATVCEDDKPLVFMDAPRCFTSSAQNVLIKPQKNAPNNFIAVSWVQDGCAFIGPIPPKLAAPSNKTNGISLYPNPASVNLTLTYGERYTGATLKILDIQGKLLREQRIETEESTVIPINDLPAGMYFINVVQADGTNEFVRFVKE